MDAQAQSLAGARRVVLWNLYVAFLALLVGGLMGPFQALENAGVNLYRFLPFLHSYYQGLTIHGVLLALVWTTFFIAGFLQFVTIHGLRRPLYSLRLAQVAFALMVVGLVAAAVPILANQATVLFTSYAPLKAHPAYYVGLALVVVGTWLISANVYLTHRDWRRQHPGERTPLMVTGAIVTLIMWDIASLGIAAEFLGLLIPMALGLTVGTNPLLARTLFWFTGHPIVYFWLLPAYISWYTMMPKQVGGKLFSDPLARLAFLLFIPFSVPVGFHHQYTDPGVPQAWKMVHALLTFAVFFPSLLTAFTVVASLETGARARGGKGALRWLTALPWGDPSVASQLLAMVLFAFGGVSGLVNASYNLNLLVHNTAWVVGHFHLTVGTAVTLSFIGIAYWLIPHLTGRALWSRRMALWQAWLWFIGMAAFSRGMHWLGLLGAPRRTMLGASVYPDPQWQPALALVSSGGLILTVSGLLLFLNLAMTVLASRRPAEVEVPEAEPLSPTPNMPLLLDRFRPWVVVTALLVVVAYGPMIVQLATTHPFDIPGRRLW